MKKKHIYAIRGLRAGSQVWVKAQVTMLADKNTLGWAHGFVSVKLETKNGLAGGGGGTVTVHDVVLRPTEIQRRRRSDETH